MNGGECANKLRGSLDNPPQDQKMETAQNDDESR